MEPAKHPIEASESWKNHLELARTAHESIDTTPTKKSSAESLRRRLKRNHFDDDKEDNYEQSLLAWHALDSKWKLTKKEKKKRKKHIKELYAHPGISYDTVHGLLIDAGSSGSRLHVYEWEPRILRDEADIQLAVSGEKLSFPGTESRWTDRLSPGLSTFAVLADDVLQDAVAKYLEPLMDFARTVLHSKSDQFDEFPIFLRATAGMRILSGHDRSRVMGAVRNVFSNNTFCPFAFVDEQARVLSGEEEAIFDWTGVNFLLGNLIEQSTGAGTVVNPRLTHGALDLGGASTQIGFYEPNEDIMSNLFKLQIGQAKHWNLYAHSYLFYGINEAIDRFDARLIAGSTKDEKEKVFYNPCLPGGSSKQVQSNIYVTDTGVETWTQPELRSRAEESLSGVLSNTNDRGDASMCLSLVKELFHLEKNDWCEFSHGDCSFAGVYQPTLPSHSDDPGFGEFVGFSNYYHVWQFLELPERASVAELKNATEHACSLSRDELVEFGAGRVPEEQLDSYCFRSAYVFQLLHNGYGFRMEDTIRATHVINGHKVGWALGAMIYEINTMPWKYEQKMSVLDMDVRETSTRMLSIFLAMTVIAAAVATGFILRRRSRHGYAPIKDARVQEQ